MKVTKVVREFVEEKINEKYPLPAEPTEAIKQERAELENRVEEAKRAASETLTNKLRELGVVYTNGIVRMGVSGFNRFNEKGEMVYGEPIRPVYLAWKEETKTIEAKRAKAQKEILVNLELGGTKAELLEMLANLPD